MCRLGKLSGLIMRVLLLLYFLFLAMELDRHNYKYAQSALQLLKHFSVTTESHFGLPKWQPPSLEQISKYLQDYSLVLVGTGLAIILWRHWVTRCWGKAVWVLAIIIMWQRVSQMFLGVHMMMIVLI